MEQYEKLVKQFNDLVDRIENYEISINEQKEINSKKIERLNSIFNDQQAQLEQLIKSADTYEQKFRESHEKIMVVVKEKIINEINSFSSLKINEIQETVSPFSNMINGVTQMLAEIKDYNFRMDERIKELERTEKKLYLIADSLSKHSGEKNVKSENFDKVSELKIKVRGNIIDLSKIFSEKGVPFDKVTYFITKFMGEIEIASKISEIEKIYEKMFLEVQMNLIDGI